MAKRSIFISTKHPVPRTAIDVAPPENSGLIEDGGEVVRVVDVDNYDSVMKEVGQ